MKKNMMIALGVLGVFVLVISLLNKKKQMNPGVTVSDPKKYKYQDFIEAASSRFGIPAARIFGHMMQESSGNPTLTGGAGERGLMQVKEIAFRDVQSNFTGFNGFDYSDLWNPAINILVGTAYLSLCHKWTGGSLDDASRAYNIGIGNFLNKKNLAKGDAYLAKVKNYEAMV